jgi:hypothetical protein
MTNMNRFGPRVFATILIDPWFESYLRSHLSPPAFSFFYATLPHALRSARHPGLSYNLRF